MTQTDGAEGLDEGGGPLHGLPWGAQAREVGGQAGLGEDPCTAHLGLRAGGLPSTGEGSRSLSPAQHVCSERRALKAQIILTTVPHSSPVLFGKQPLSCCTKRGFFRSPAVLGANLLPGARAAEAERCVGPRSANTPPAERQSLSYRGAGARSGEPSVPAANYNYLSACQPPLSLTLPMPRGLGGRRIPATMGPGPLPISQRQGTEQTVGELGVPQSPRMASRGSSASSHVYL